jgi:predicted nucleic acid-binding protein
VVFLLDTNILSELVRRQPHAKVLEQFNATPQHELFTSVVCVEEIRFGCRLVPHGEAKWRAVLAKVLSRVTVLDFTYPAAVRAGELRAEWKQAGTPVGYDDGLIAAVTLVADLILVTRNVRHFDHVSNLKVENWFE